MTIHYQIKKKHIPLDKKGNTALERLQYILLFKELEFPLKDIRDILDSADFDQQKALE